MSQFKVVSSVPSPYADGIAIQQRSIGAIKVLKPRRVNRPIADLQALLPAEKPQLGAVRYLCIDDVVSELLIRSFLLSQVTLPKLIITRKTLALTVELIV